MARKQKSIMAFSAVQKWAAFLFAKRVNATMVFGYIEGRGRRRADRKSGNASLPQTERA
jgi:hypothetical protein